MNLGVMVPLLFYDLIGRVVPGATLAGCASIASLGPQKALQLLSTWSACPKTPIPATIIILGNLLCAYIIGALLGGIWFRIYRLGWSKSGEKRIEKLFRLVTPPKGQVAIERQLETTQKISLMYDYVQLRCPKASARIAKLHAEQHMSGVLMIGFLVLAILWLCPSLRYDGFSLATVDIVETLLLFGAMSSGMLAWHLEKRSGTALYYSWLLANSGIDEEG